MTRASQIRDRAWRLAVVIIAIAGAIELLLAVWAHHGRVSYERYDAERMTPTLVPGSHRTPFGVVVVDEHGFTASAPRVPASDADRYRRNFEIVALGDSCTFGAGDAATTYPVALEELLARNESSGYGYRVVNAGIAGLTSDE
ncbi:hypothetical protein K2X89_12745, partial [Myxococcota bacterium]|nr:hypothetical protein [Myxococcota bacterium]